MQPNSQAVGFKPLHCAPDCAHHPWEISLGHARQFHDVRLTIASIRDSLDVDRPCQKTENKTFPAIYVFAVKDGESCRLATTYTH